jgi:hypothetical protein
MRAPNTTPIERAFELARSGRCQTTADIKQHLRQEGYSTHSIIGPLLMKQLRAAMDDASGVIRRDDAGPGGIARDINQRHSISKGIVAPPPPPEPDIRVSAGCAST